MITMRQSDYETPSIYVGDEDGLATGSMGGCVSVIALYDGNQTIGQHGAGGIASVNFIELVRRGRIPNAPATTFFVLWAPGLNSVRWEIQTKLKEMIEEKQVPNLGLCQFAVYTAGNGLVTPAGQVFAVEMDGGKTGPLKPKCQFILKFIDKLKNVFD